MIRTYANELEHDRKMGLHDISKHITQVLKGYVTRMYIQLSLEEKYKREYAVQNRSNSQFTTLEHHLDAIKKDVNKVIAVGQKQGLSIEDVRENTSIKRILYS